MSSPDRGPSPPSASATAGSIARREQVAAMRKEILDHPVVREGSAALTERLDDANEFVAKFMEASVVGDVTPKSHVSWFNHAASLFVGFSVSKTLVAPLERFRMLQQVGRISNQRKELTLKNWRSFQMLQREVGLPGLYRGNLVNIARSLPTCFVPFASYDAFKQLLYVPGVAAVEVSTVTKLFVGGISSAFFLLVTYPLDFMRTRIACDSYLGRQPYQYESVLSCYQSAIKDVGYPGLYKGFIPAVLWTIPYTSVAFTAYENLKTKFGADQRLSWRTMLAGGIAGAYAEAIAYPLDTLQRRMIMDGVRPLYQSTSSSQDFMEVGMQIFENEGFLGFYRGMLPNMLRSAFQMSAMFCVYELCNGGKSSSILP